MSSQQTLDPTGTPSGFGGAFSFEAVEIQRIRSMIEAELGTISLPQAGRILQLAAPGLDLPLFTQALLAQVSQGTQGSISSRPASEAFALPEPTSHFDAVICRNLMVNLTEDQRRSVLQEIFRVLKPGGKICLIELDGLLFHLFPQPTLVSDVYQRLKEQAPSELKVGRKLPFLLTEMKFSEVAWKIKAIECSGERLGPFLAGERLAATQGRVAELLGDPELAERFREAFCQGVSQPGAVLFFNKFIITGRKSPFRVVG